MSATNTCFEAVPLGPSAVPYASTDTHTPVHCASEMEMVIPAVGSTAVDYTFEPPDGPLRLPPVWRCSCGFQLDAWATGWPQSAPELPPSGRRVPVLTATAGA